MAAPTRILVIDNYDSFVYTLVGYLRELGAETTVVRNDDVTVAQAIELAESVTSNAPMSLRVTKQMLAEAPHQSLPDGLKQAAELNAVARGSESLKEGVASFLEKRAADWNSVTER